MFINNRYMNRYCKYVIICAKVINNIQIVNQISRTKTKEVRNLSSIESVLERMFSRSPCVGFNGLHLNE